MFMLVSVLIIRSCLVPFLFFDILTTFTSTSRFLLFFRFLFILFLLLNPHILFFLLFLFRLQCFHSPFLNLISILAFIHDSQMWILLLTFFAEEFLDIFCLLLTDIDT